MGAQTIIFYVVSFSAIYVQIFFLMTFLEGKKKITYRDETLALPDYPAVTVIVPCWNEETTIQRTVESLLALEYPKDKLEIFLVDDGSTDNTWEVMKAYESHPQIKTLHKENGGKHTAMNWGIEHSTSDFVGCLDADSFVHPEALKRIMSYFSNAETMAVAPSIIVHQPKTLIQKIQKIEYNMAVYVKKMLGISGGIHVTPGPLSIYRKSIFKTIGMFRKAHNTEDMEIAYRMQKHHLKIEQCNDAYVYTVAPNTVKKLYKQRLRWIHGFIRNTFDYRDILFRRKYGTFSIFTVPSGIISITAALFFFGLIIFKSVDFIVQKIVQFQTVGWQFHAPHFVFDWFFINTQTTIFLSIILYGLIVFATLVGTRMAEGKPKFSFHIVSYILVYSVIAPVWLVNAMYNAVFLKGTRWR